MDESRIHEAYELAKARYADWDVDAEAALHALGAVRLSMHCWQADDVGGFETPDASLADGGIQVTGAHPGKARTLQELRADLDAALALIPGTHRINLHAIYGDFGGARVDRDAYGLEHFQGWIDWAKERDLYLDFNATCFSHPKAAEGYTLSHADEGIRAFWIEHVRRCRAIAAAMGEAQGAPCVHNLWIPDGGKDTPADRWGPRARLRSSLDAIFAEAHPRGQLLDAVECKLFGIGSESYVVGSHEFYLAYALTQGLAPCLDMGHFHPTESVADKLSSVLTFCDRALLHVSRGVRWDSDHVVLFDDATRAVMAEVVRGGAVARVAIALDFFDGSINRTAAYVTGMRATQKALLAAFLEPHARLNALESEGRLGERLALMDECAAMPLGAVWDEFCLRHGVPAGSDWIAEARRYEEAVLAARS